MPDVKDIVRDHLLAHGYDGLSNYTKTTWFGECACDLADLCPCDGEGGVLSCVPGHKVPCPSDCGEHEWHIEPKPSAVPPRVREFDTKGGPR
jgi:hypothetical protein